MYCTRVPDSKGFRCATGEKVPFLSDKEKFQPFKEPVMSRHRQKQFLTTVPKEPFGGKVGFFNPLTYPTGKDRYNDTTGYLRTQPLDKRLKGFGSRDCKRRDQFTRYVETERYREQLKAEQKVLRRVLPADIPVVSDAALDTARDAAAHTARGRDYVLREIPTNGYDRMRADFTLMDKLHEEKGWRHRRASSARRLGTYKLSSHAVGGDLVWNVERPEYGNVAATKDFYNRGHIGEL